MATLAPYVFWQELDNSGNPLASGKVYTYEAGTSTPKATYTDSTGGTPNANPVVLDSAGRAQIWLGDGGYKFVIKTSADVTIATRDNVGGAASTALGGNTVEISTNTSVTATDANTAYIATAALTISLVGVATAGEGFYFLVYAQGGAVTIDPNGAETIDNASTATIQQGTSALVITDGDEWWIFFNGAGLAANNTFTGTNTFTGVVAISGTASTAGGVSMAEDTDNGTNKVTIKAPDSLAADYTMKLPTADGSSGYLLQTDGSGNLSFAANIFLAGMKDRLLNGLTMSNGTDATNDIDIAAGSCVSDDGTTLMTLSAITKQLDAAWAVGTAAGGLDTGAIANTTYHIWVIHRPDTGVTDALFSTSASSPTMPTNYTKKKCIGSIIRSGGTILAFSQLGNEFLLSTSIQDVNATNPGTSAVTRTLTVPTGAKVWAIVSAGVYPATSAAANFYISSLDQSDETPVIGTSGADSVGTACSDQQMAYNTFRIRTNTSAQVRSRLSTSGAADKVMIRTYGWVDPRI